MEAATVTVAEDPHPAIAAMTPNDLPEVAAMDLSVFGAPRAELLEWMYAGAPEYATIARRDGRLAGYLFGRHGFDFEHLGPIVAVDAQLAEAMTAACLSRHRGRPFIIDATCHAVEWMQFLERAGFREQRPFIRMHRGGQLPFGGCGFSLPCWDRNSGERGSFRTPASRKRGEGGAESSTTDERSKRS